MHCFRRSARLDSTETNLVAGGTSATSHPRATLLGYSSFFFGYVTWYYPPQLDDKTGDTDPELFHIEFDDGDEEDMDSAELGHAIQLAREQGYASAEDGEEEDEAMDIATDG